MFRKKKHVDLTKHCLCLCAHKQPISIGTPWYTSTWAMRWRFPFARICLDCHWRAPSGCRRWSKINRVGRSGLVRTKVVCWPSWTLSLCQWMKDWRTWRTWRKFSSGAAQKQFVLIWVRVQLGKKNHLHWLFWSQPSLEEFISWYLAWPWLGRLTMVNRINRLFVGQWMVN